MKNIWAIFKGDVNRIRKNVIAMIVIVGITVVPSLYAWFNIAASWNPYENTGGLKVAVATVDEGYEGDLISVNLNLGEQVISALHENTQLDWIFTTKKKAVNGVKSGKYYAAIVIPKEFSKNMMSVFTEDVQKPQIMYYSNAKENAIAPKVTDNGAAAIWCQPIYWDMAMNAYKRAKAEGDTERENKYKQLCDDLFAGNKAHYVNFDFDNNNENTGWFIYDDIQWWTITLARAYELFKVEEYRSLAEASFARVWYGSPRVGDTGSYADPEKNLGGGMFWQWQPIGNPNENAAGDGKMACINFPTVVAALTLYNNVPADRVADPNPENWSNKYGDFTRPHYETKEAYLAKGKEIYEWAVKNLVDSNTGEVADSKHGEGNPAWSDHVYNQATFIGILL